ncbi:DUF4431 domain-containing protein [Capnocytophaga canis]|uniref:DUF4431 domain-containing protein n=1 Tax=Capnocytophaga canis TaxID=1848903 RepID=UPI001561F08D|nr:DUF4431 domain-containing protein [Capnocytophaga canis]
MKSNNLIFLGLIGLVLSFVGCKDNSKQQAIQQNVQSNIASDFHKPDENIKKNAEGYKEYFYEPSISVISGIIKIKTFFGPPGYGESPEVDAKEEVFILELRNPINLVADEEDDGFNPAQTNILEVQLTSTSDIKFTNYIDKNVCLTGSFFGAHTGHHFTDVLMDVAQIKKE